MFQLQEVAGCNVMSDVLCVAFCRFLSTGYTSFVAMLRHTSLRASDRIYRIVDQVDFI